MNTQGTIASSAKQFVGVLLLLLAGCQSSFPPALNAPAQAESPKLSVGDSWVYRYSDGFTQQTRGNFTHTITAIAGDVVTVEIKSADGRLVRTDRYTRDWNWLEHPMTNLQPFKFEPAYPALSFPLASGKSWGVATRATDVANGENYDFGRIEGKASDWQRVTVPAGAFDAIHVQRTAYAGTQTSERSQDYITERDWYAPAVNNMVMSSYRSIYIDKASGVCIDATRPKDWTLLELVEYRPARR
jgi:hypothetical protein